MIGRMSESDSRLGIRASGAGGAFLLLTNPGIVTLLILEAGDAGMLWLCIQ
jgi:hypothetical protein